jgi:hypothetical protein
MAEYTKGKRFFFLSKSVNGQKDYYDFRRNTIKGLQWKHIQPDLL